MTPDEMVSQNLTKLSPQQLYTLTMALLTMVVSQVVAFVPSLGTDKQNLISAGGIVVTVAILLGGALHHYAQTNASKTAARSLPVTDADRLRAQLVAAGHTPEA